MASLALGVAGAVAGSALGGPLGASIGFQIGSAVGNLLFPEKIQGPRLDDLKLHNSSYGQMSPRVWGTVRVAGNIIDEQPELTEHEETEGGKGGPEVTNYTYTCSFAVRLCERVGDRESAILGIRRIWANGRLVYDTTGGTTVDNEALPMTVYLGTETQLPDPTLETIHGAGEVPGYRGIAYVVFTDLELGPYGNTLPNFNFEIYTHAGTIPQRISTFDAQSFPGSGTVSGVVVNVDGTITEYVYLSDATFEASTFDFDGTAVGSPVSGTCSGAEHFMYAVVTNMNCAVYATGPGGTDAAFFVDGNQGHTLLGAYPTPVGVMGMLQDNILYFPTTGGVVGYPVVEGQPQAVPVGTMILAGVSSADIVIGHSDNGKVYAWDGGSGDMYEIEPDLSEVTHTWVAADFPSDGAFYHGGFVRFNDFFAINYGDFSIDRLNLIAIAADYTLTNYDQPRGLLDVPDFEWAGGRMAPLGGGYYLGKDGIVLLEPPLDGVPLSEIVRDISIDCGLEDADIDVSDLTDIVDGYPITQQATGRDWIQPLRDAWFFDGTEEDDQVVFVKRGKASKVTIPDDDLAAHMYESEAPEIVGLTRGDELSLPQTVNVSHIDNEADFQTGTQYDRRQVTLSRSEVTLNLQICMNSRKARSIAQAQLYTAWIERNKISLWTSRKYSKYSPTDVVTVRGIDLRLVEKSEGAGGVIEWKAVQDQSTAFTQPGVPVRRSDFTTSPPTPTDSSDNVVDALLLDLPLVSETDTANGFYAAMRPTATLFKSTDSGSTYSSVATATVPAVIGETSDALGPFYGGNVFDEANLVTVVLTGGTLSSSSETAVLNGANEAVVGDEVIQFKTAELVDTDTYELTGLLRGRLGTEWAMSAHGSGERFALLPTLRVAQPFSELNQPRLFKPVPAGGTLAGATAQGFTNSGNALRPYSPVLLGGGNDGGDVTLNWTRRTRIGGAWLPFNDVPLSESSESYVVQIWNADYTQVARIITGITSQTTTYTSAQQVTDFGAEQQTIYFTVAQVGAVLGRSERGTAVGAGSTDDDPISPIPPYQSPTSGSPEPPPDLDALELAFTWATPGSQRLYSFMAGDFVCDKILVCSFTTPGSTLNDVRGNIVCDEWGVGTGPVTRLACLSTVAGDFSGSVLGPLSRVVSSAPNIQFTVGTNTAGHPQLSPSTTYYYNVKNDNGFGACTCFTDDCGVFVELRKPTGL